MSNPVGRPRLEIDIELLKDLAEIHCTMEEMSHILGCSVDTLENNFSEVIKAAQAKGKSSLRRMQVKAAKEGSQVMLVWLGKQLLKQKDKSDEEIEAIRSTGVIASDEDLKRFAEAAIKKAKEEQCSQKKK